uniref:Catechol O-methyltransferase n=1 Tax=Alexandrium monilatum TaxID=311494 RepID=A0A7S4V9N6_9DINO
MPLEPARGAARLALHAACWWLAAADAGWGCGGSGTVAAEEWAAALHFLNGSGGPSAGDFDAWSQVWAPLAQAAASDLQGSLEACAEGTVAALAHALPALDAARGDALSLELVKYLHHHLSGGGAAPAPAPASAARPWGWQRHWLAAVASLLRFVYAKWVNVPQDAPRGDGGGADPVAVAVAPGVLTRHHGLLFRAHLDEFVRSGVYDLDIAENSVLFSEAFAFAAFCRLHGVGAVLESGVYRGFSTEVWSLFAEEVVAVDLFPGAEVLEAARQRLRRRANVRLVRGDGKAELPRLLEERSGARVAVFIDGPKGELAIRLALKLRGYPQVAFVAMHDMAPYRGALRAHGAYFFTDEPWFQREYGHLDEPFKRRTDLQAGGTMAFIS